jgi:hypothetical protein
MNFGKGISIGSLFFSIPVRSSNLGPSLVDYHVMTYLTVFMEDEWEAGVFEARSGSLSGSWEVEEP